MSAPDPDAVPTLPYSWPSTFPSELPSVKDGRTDPPGEALKLALLFVGGASALGVIWLCLHLLLRHLAH